MYYKETKKEIDGEGNIIRQECTEKEYYKETEPEYIKIYTAMFFEFKQFPVQYRELFLQLAMRMTYCNSNDFGNSQIVYVAGPIRKAILESCGWTNVSSLTKGLNALCTCGAIRRVDRATYQINPEFAGKGSWRYNSKLAQGGVKDIIAQFHFADRTVFTQFDYSQINIVESNEEDEEDECSATVSDECQAGNA